MADTHVSRAEIAARLGLSERQVTNLVRSGRLADGTPFPSRVRGRTRTFPTDRCFAWYIRFKQEEALERAATRESPTNMQEAELRKAVADAEMAELRLATMRGDVVPIEQYRRELHRTLSRVAARFASVPGEYAPRILEPLDMPRAVKLLRELVATVMAELQSAAGSTTDLEDDPPAEDVA